MFPTRSITAQNGRPWARVTTQDTEGPGGLLSALPGGRAKACGAPARPHALPALIPWEASPACHACLPPSRSHAWLTRRLSISVPGSRCSHLPGAHSRWSRPFSAARTPRHLLGPLSPVCLSFSVGALVVPPKSELRTLRVLPPSSPLLNAP